MRALMISVLALGISVGIYTVRAQARPKKIDYHSAICQKTNNGTLSYSSGGITAATDVNIVCPLQHVTLEEDTPPGANGLVKITVKMRTGGIPTATTTCQVMSEGLTFFHSRGFSQRASSPTRATSPFQPPTPVIRQV